MAQSRKLKVTYEVGDYSTTDVVARLAIKLLLPILRLPVDFFSDSLASIAAVPEMIYVLRLRLIVRVVIWSGNDEAFPVG